MDSVFIATLTYTVPIEQVDVLLADHLAWLKAGHENGHFLAWGPNNPRDSGTIFIRATDRAEAEAVTATDPFLVGNVATITITEWTPRFIGPGLEALSG
ncbi:YciI family protein [Erythrobacter sp. Alg231-14]|uniref:YciI family protein n=1 Tax=Erythrobacter sp. Alg231-14 TaxID=1922225 RepID=UPI00307C7DCD